MNDNSPHNKNRQLRRKLKGHETDVSRNVPKLRCDRYHEPRFGGGESGVLPVYSGPQEAAQIADTFGDRMGIINTGSAVPV